MKLGENKYPEGTRCQVVNTNRQEFLGKKVTIDGWSVAEQCYIITVDEEVFQRKCQQECLKLLEYPLYIQQWLQTKMMELLSPNPEIIAQLLEERRDGQF